MFLWAVRIESLSTSAYFVLKLSWALRQHLTWVWLNLSKSSTYRVASLMLVDIISKQAGLYRPVLVLSICRYFQLAGVCYLSTQFNFQGILTRL